MTTAYALTEEPSRRSGLVPAKVCLRPPEPSEEDLAAAERRARRRLPIEIDVEVEGAAQRFRATTGDISPGGVFVQTRHAIPIGTNVVLALTLPSGASLEVLGVVQWRRERHEDALRGDVRDANADAPGCLGPGMGIAFFCLDPEVKAMLTGFCQVREPLYLDAEEVTLAG